MGAFDTDFRSGVGTVIKSYAYSSPGGATGLFYSAGFYESADLDANLNQGLTTQVFGSANSSYAAHAFIVAGAAGTATGGSGAVIVTVTGTSITDAGVRTGTDSETIVADITALATDQYIESTKKWLGIVTFTLDVGATGHTAYALDFNYGLAKYEDSQNTDFTIRAVECVGLAGAADTSFNIQICHHEAVGWTYAASGFMPGATTLWDMNVDHGTEQNLINGEHFAWKKTGLSQFINGDTNEGFLVRVTTGANNAVDYMNIHIAVTF